MTAEFTTIRLLCLALAATAAGCGPGGCAGPPATTEPGSIEPASTEPAPAVVSERVDQVLPPDPLPPPAVEPGPIVFDAIYYDHYRQRGSSKYRRGQGPRVGALRRQGSIPLLPVIYGWAIDPHNDGTIDRDRMRQWIAEVIPADYDGPACLDFEQPYFEELMARSIDPRRLSRILAVYIDGLEIARSIRPRARWGYWGLPLLRNTHPAWRGQGLSMEPLLEASDAIFPSIYDCHPGKDNSGSIGRHISQVLADVRGRKPVYVFAWNRHCGQGGNRRVFVSEQEFRKNARAALAARWTDPTGTEHRIAGIVLWDAYTFAVPEEYDRLDLLHVECLRLMLEEAGRTGDVPAPPESTPPAVLPRPEGGIDRPSGGVASPGAPGERPVVLNGIYYDFLRPARPHPGQGARARARRESMVPIVYGYSIDRNSDGRFDQGDRAHLRAWIRTRIPSAYRGPAVLDYEPAMWKELSRPRITPGRLAEILAVYADILAAAKETRPDLQWGFYGLPKLRHTNPAWQKQHRAALRSLLLQQGAVFPSIYDASRGKDDYKLLRAHVEGAIDLVDGNRPVYVFLWNRHVDAGGSNKIMVADAEFRRNAAAALDARRRGQPVAGVVLWDAYTFTPATDWNELDEQHARHIGTLQGLVEERYGRGSD